MNSGTVKLTPSFVAVNASSSPAGTSRITADVGVRSDGTSVRLDDGTLAGSVLSMDAAVRNLDRWTIFFAVLFVVNTIVLLKI